MAKAVLPEELISLIHHIELNKAGWWDKSVQQLIVESIRLSGKPLTLKDISTDLIKNFSISIDSHRLKVLIDEMRSSGVLVPFHGEKFKISESSQIEIVNKFKETEEMENRVKRKFAEVLISYNLQIEPEKTWYCFRDYFLFPLVREMGAKTYELISGTIVSAELNRTKSFQEFLSNYSAEHQNNLKDAIISFLDPKDPDVRSCVFQYLNTYFLLESCNLPEESIKALDRLNQQPPSFTIFVDTNFLFSILDLHDNPSNETAQLLMELVDQISSRVTVRFEVLPTTVDESRRTLRYYQQRLERLRLTPSLSNVATKGKISLSGIALKFVQANAVATHPINAREYFYPYINDLINVLKSKNVEFCDEDVDKYKVDQRVTDDILDRQEFEERRHYGDRAKSYEALEHDILMWYFVKDRRPQRVESPLDAKYWVATIDFRFLGFDAFKTRSMPNEIPVCIHPAMLIQMLQLWLPRTPKFEEAVLSSLRPLISQDFDPETEKMTIDILSSLSRFENVDDLPEDVVGNILMSDALRQRMSAEQDINEQIELVKEALIEETKKVSEQLEATKEEKTSLSEEADKFKHQLEQEQKLRGDLEERLNQLEQEVEKKEKFEEAEKQKRRFLIKWSITTITLILLALCIYVVIEYLTTWGLLKILGVWGILLIFWTWLTDRYGSKNPAIKDQHLFKLFHEVCSKIFYVIGTVAATLLANWIEKIW